MSNIEKDSLEIYFQTMHIKFDIDFLPKTK